MLLKRRILGGFITAWLILQIVIPFTRKFDIFNFHYRYALFSWAMYSKPALIYEVSLFRLSDSGPEAIPNIKEYVREYVSPQSMQLSDYYRSMKEIQGWHAQLIKNIAHRENDGRTYAASIHWIRKFDSDSPDDWNFKTRPQGYL